MRIRKLLTVVLASVALAASLAEQIVAQTAPGSATVLYSFCSVIGCSDGSYPEAGVIFDKAGNLYGTTNAGGAGCGTVFTLSADSGGWTQSTIYTFTDPDDGLGPNSLAIDNQGNLYGTTEYGGGGGGGTCSNGGCGTVFELVNANGVWTKTILYRFAGGTDGAIPMAGVILDPAGNLYGTTWQGGGDLGAGTAFELTHSGSGWSESVIHSFTGGDDGRAPLAGLVLDNAGHLYGTTNQGGTAQSGTVFELGRGHNGWSEIVLHSFTGGPDGGGPYNGSLILDSAGNVYGTTSQGGFLDGGTVFELSRPRPGVTRKKLLYAFQGVDGSAPYNGVIMNAEGKLFGTTSIGGKRGNGTVFSLTNAGGGHWTEVVLDGFDGTDGSEPIGNLVFDSAGNIYGTNGSGGSRGAGNVFEVTP